MIRQFRSWAFYAVVLVYAIGHVHAIELPTGKSDKLKALIIDGQNNHPVWPKTSQMMKHYLDETGLFDVQIATTAPDGIDEDFQPRFKDYAVVVSNYNGQPWNEQASKSFVEYMRLGGGLVTVHAADNAFPEWPEFNVMIGLGGWGGRNQISGPYVYYSDDNKIVRDQSDGNGGSHGEQHEFTIVVRDSDHPITNGLPMEWMHTKDELYDRLRGPGMGMKILATAFSHPKTGGSGRHEPILMAIEYHNGRIFHTTLGHEVYSQECVGFITTFQRGAEWAATGKVTQKLPDDFPPPDKSRSRPFTPPRSNHGPK
jgi:type 1 glutamine amidotransferase